MTITITDRLNELDAHVSRLVILPLMTGSDAAEDLLCDCWDELPELLGFNDKQYQQYTDTVEDESPTKFLNELGFTTGVFFAVEGKIYKNCTDELEGKFEHLVSMHRITGRRAVEYGYAPSLDKLDEAMDNVLDKLTPRLLED